jgi:hypothetical protein
VHDIANLTAANFSLRRRNVAFMQQGAQWLPVSLEVLLDKAI